MMAEERATETTPLPPYFDRFIEERDRRLVAELGRLDTSIQHNAQRISELRQEMERRFEEMERRFEDVERRFAEAMADRVAIRQEMRQEFVDARDERKAIRTELRGEINRLDTKIDSHFRLMMGVIIPIAVGILAIIIRIFFLGPIP